MCLADRYEQVEGFSYVMQHHRFLSDFGSAKSISTLYRLVIIAEGFHSFPSRTRSLSPLTLMVLGPQGPGRVSSRQAIHKTYLLVGFFAVYFELELIERMVFITIKLFLLMKNRIKQLDGFFSASFSILEEKLALDGLGKGLDSSFFIKISINKQTNLQYLYNNCLLYNILVLRIKGKT